MSSSLPSQTRVLMTRALTFLTPAARSILNSAGIVDVEKLVGTGKGGRVTKEDALKRLQAAAGRRDVERQVQSSSGVASVSSPPPQQQQQPQPPPNNEQQPLWLDDSRGPFKLVPITNIRKVTADRLTESKQQIPHMYLSMDVDVDPALQSRAQLKRIGAPTPSLNDFIIKAAALSLRAVPNLNVQLSPQGVVKHIDSVDISVAVATPRGLITPIVTKADEKSLVQISNDMHDLAKRAKENKLKPMEFIGGSFTISNLGMMGIDDFTAVINPPQAAILAVGSGAIKLAAPPSGKGGSMRANTFREGEYEYIPIADAKRINVMTVTLSVDRRIVDEIEAANFLATFRAMMEAPARL